MNYGGIMFVNRVLDVIGMCIDEIVRVFVIVDCIFEIGKLWIEVNCFDNIVLLKM